MSRMPDAPERPLRRDAERNRQRIVEAAREVFAEHGLRASYDDIARQAGVGVGTVYRRFPDKEQLVDVLFEERMSAVGALAGAGLAMEDPWDGLVSFVVGMQEFQCADRGLKELVLSSDAGHDRVSRARSQIAPLLEALLDRARAAGAVRSDLALTDLPLIQIALGGVVDATREVAPETWRRMLAIVLDGLRADTSGATPFVAAPLDLEQLDVALRATSSARRR